MCFEEPRLSGTLTPFFLNFGGTGNRWDIKGGTSYETVIIDKNWNRTERRKRNVIGLRFDVYCFV